MRFVLFQFVWILWTLLLGLLSPLVLLSKSASLWLTWLWNHSTLWLADHLGGMHLRIEGREHLAEGAAIYASKHQSALDTFALWVALDNPAFVLKKELLSIPIFGWFLARTNPIAIDRSAGKAAVEQIAEQAEEKLVQGRSIVIFPEGTRYAYGAPPKYKSGGLMALYALGYPIIPVALNTGKLWPKKGTKQTGEAIIRFTPPLPPEGLTKEALLPQLQEACESLHH